jgi:hypothetical protein
MSLIRVIRTESASSAVLRDAELTPQPERPPVSYRPFGLAQGEFVVPDDFDAPLPDEFVRQFYGQ